MGNRQLTDISRHLPDPDADQADTVLMSGKGSEHVFDELRQRYERRIESQEHRLLEGGDGPAPLQHPAEPNSEVSLEPASPEVLSEPDVPWYVWGLVAASSVLLLAAAAAVLIIVS